MSALLTIEDLSIAFAGQTGDRAAVRGLSLSLHAAEVLGLVGESGSGKTATALAVLRLLPSSATLSGRVMLEGRDLTALDEAQMCAVRGRDIGVVFQEPATALNPVMTIGDQVAEAARVHGQASRLQARALASTMLARVGLQPDQVSPARYPHELSGGQRQRVAIAAAIALSPRLLIADEPTTALDAVTQAQITALLVGLVRETGMGLILVSHDLALAAGACDRIAVMQSGRLVDQGAPATLLTSSRHAYVRRLRDAARLPAAPAVGVADAAEVLLEAEALVRDYPARRRSWRARAQPLRALDGVSLTLRRRESLGIVGRSGSGKSTLLRLLLGLDRPQAGRVRLGGADFSHPSARDQRPLRRRIQAVFQDPYGSFDPLWRVEQTVAEPLGLLDALPDRPTRRARVEALLRRVGLSAADADRHPHAFSGGQRQRIAIARALILEPDIVAFDEATSALDVSTRAEVLALLAELRAEFGLACLFVSHDLAVVRAVTDRVMVMQAGRVVETGWTAEVFTAPVHPYTRALLAATPDLDRALGVAGPSL